MSEESAPVGDGVRLTASRDPDLVPHLGDSLPAVGRLLARQTVPILVAVQTLAGIGRLSTAEWVVAAVAIVALGAAWGTVTTRREGDRFDVAMLLVTVAAGVALTVLTNSGQVYVTAYSALFVSLFWYDVPAGLVVAVPAVAAVTFDTMFVGQRDILGGIGNGVGATFFGVAALFWGRVLVTSRRNAELVAELRETRESEQAHAVASERARLAREIHDVLAHTLSSLALHLESTRVLGRSRDVDADVLERIDRALALARTGLDEARQAVGTLRDDELPGPERIPALVEDYRRVTGVPVRLDVEGSPVELGPEGRVALFRAAQEALTNIGKHARPGAVEISLQWQASGVRLTVRDDGRCAGEPLVGPGPADGPDPDAPDGARRTGNGLRGMRERAELAGGSVSAGPVTGGGFAVEMWLPA